MTTITCETASGCMPTFVVRSTDLKRPEGFRRIDDAIRYCRQLGLPYTIR